MADQEKTVQLVAPNGVTVRVSESKADARLAAGYTKAPAKRSAAKKSND